MIPFVTIFGVELGVVKSGRIPKGILVGRCKDGWFSRKQYLFPPMLILGRWSYYRYLRNDPICGIWDRTLQRVSCFLLAAEYPGPNVGKK